jgi:hypothetical protein
MFQNAIHTELLTKCDVNGKAGVLFEEQIIQKVVNHIIQSCIKHSSSNAVDFYLMYSLLLKYFFLSLTIYPNV